MKKILVIALFGALFSTPILASNFSVTCPSCGKTMFPGTWHKCAEKLQKKSLAY